MDRVVTPARPRPAVVRRSILGAMSMVAVAALVGCGADPSPTPPAVAAPAGGAGSAPAGPGTVAPGSAAAVATTSAPAATSPVDEDIAVSIAKRKVTPPTGRVQVARGARVRITVTSDVADTVHVHGYDESTKVSAGAAASLEFTADQAGLFEVETHDDHLVLFQLVVR